MLRKIGPNGVLERYHDIPTLTEIIAFVFDLVFTTSEWKYWRNRAYREAIEHNEKVICLKFFDENIHYYLAVCRFGEVMEKDANPIPRWSYIMREVSTK